MIDTTTPKDLADKIEWIGFGNLSQTDVHHVARQLMEVSEHLPAILALGVWRHFGLKAPKDLTTKSAQGCLLSYREREKARKMLAKLFAEPTP